MRALAGLRAIPPRARDPMQASQHWPAARAGAGLPQRGNAAEQKVGVVDLFRILSNVHSASL
jgi:hypothetical protein